MSVQDVVNISRRGQVTTFVSETEMRGILQYLKRKHCFLGKHTLMSGQWRLWMSDKDHKDDILANLTA